MARPVPNGEGLMVWDLDDVSSEELEFDVKEVNSNWLAFYVGYGTDTDYVVAKLEKFSRELREDRPIGIPTGLVMRVDPKERPSDYDPMSKIASILYNQAKHEPQFICFHLSEAFLHADFVMVESFFNRMVSGQIGVSKAIGFMIQYPDQDLLDVNIHDGPTANMRYLARKFRFCMMPSPGGHNYFKNTMIALRGMGEPMKFPSVMNPDENITLDAATQDAPPKPKPRDKDEGAIAFAPEKNPDPETTEDKDAEILPGLKKSQVPPEIISQMSQGPDTVTSFQPPDTEDPPPASSDDQGDDEESPYGEAVDDTEVAEV